MVYTDKQIEHIQYAFRAFCKKVLYHEAINAYRDLQRRQKHETSLDALSSMEPTAFMEQEIAVSFTVRGQVFFVANEQLADALLTLPEQQREILFLYFYFGYSDKEIGALIGRSRSATNRRRDIAIKQLQKEMEALRSNE
nr:sigma-70 family RNA polymerase sigma factor [Ruthenibacterium lactatiformans]